MKLSAPNADALDGIFAAMSEPMLHVWQACDIGLVENHDTEIPWPRDQARSAPFR